MDNQNNQLSDDKQAEDPLIWINEQQKTPKKNLLTKIDNPYEQYFDRANKYKLQTTPIMNKIKSIELEKPNLKPIYKNQILWLTHYFINLPKYSSNHQQIAQLITQNLQNFTKAIIYCETQLKCRKVFNSFPSTLGPIIITNKNTTQQKQQKYYNFILQQNRILVTNLQPQNIFVDSCLDIQEVNFIINQIMPNKPEIYKNRTGRSTSLMEGSKGKVISFISQSFEQKIVNKQNKKSQQIINLQNILQIKLIQYKINFKSIQKKQNKNNYQHNNQQQQKVPNFYLKYGHLLNKYRNYGNFTNYDRNQYNFQNRLNAGSRSIPHFNNIVPKQKSPEKKTQNTETQQKSKPPPVISSRIQTKCSICTHYIPTHCIPTCGHLCVCAQCIKGLTKCPICREKGNFIRVYV